jgi:hypothetical protein
MFYQRECSWLLAVLVYSESYGGTKSMLVERSVRLVYV